MQNIKLSVVVFRTLTQYYDNLRLHTEDQLLWIGISHTFLPSRQMLNMFLWTSERSRLLFEKLMQFVTKFPNIYGTWRFIHKSLLVCDIPHYIIFFSLLLLPIPVVPNILLGTLFSNTLNSGSSGMRHFYFMLWSTDPEIPRILRNPKLQRRFTRAGQWSLSWATLVQSSWSHPISLRSILIHIIFPSTPMSPD
jgi:hypothetical protein